MNDLFKGIISAIVSTFDAQDRFNPDAQRQVVRHNLKLGVRCFYVCGTTGESFSMSKEERMQVAETVRSETAGDRAAMMVNVSHMEFRAVLELADHACRIGADAISVLPPLYFPISAEEMVQYWLTILDRVNPMPVTLYNIPLLTGAPATESMVKRLAEKANFLGVKHSSEDTFLLNRFKQIDNGRLLVWNGRDAYYLGGLSMGADGGIGSSFNLLGDLFIALSRTYHAGRTVEALRIQELINSVHSRLQPNGHIKSIKYILGQLGINAGVCRLPYQSLTKEAEAYLRETMTMLDDIRPKIHQIASRS